jgi:Rab family protein
MSFTERPGLKKSIPMCTFSDPPFKVSFIGPCSAGKTSLITCFCDVDSDTNPQPTTGAVFVIHQMSTADGPIALQIWDTAGQERFRSLVPIYSRNASALVIVFDVSSLHSFDEAQEWTRKFHNSDPIVNQHIYIVGNKIDLHAAVDLDAGSAFAQQMGAKFFRTSAVTAYGVRDLFETIATDVSTRQRAQATACPIEIPPSCPAEIEEGCC